VTSYDDLGPAKAGEEGMMRFSRFLNATVALAILHMATSAMAEDAVDKFIQAEMEKQHIPGLSLLVARSGRVIRAQGYGLSNVELQVPVKPDTVFQSGSVGKQFTATAIMMLVEDGKVRLEDPIKCYIKESPATWNQVTVRELLSHTAGFTDYPKKFDFRKDYTEPELLKIVTGIPLAFEPGTKWSYSNLGYLTLGIMIHRVTGKFYGDFLQERIFRPLGMTTTRVMSESDIIPNRAAGYQLVKGVLKNQDWVSPTLNTTADGSLYFSVLDLAKWDAALYTQKLLKRSSLEEMWTVTKLKNGKENPGHYGFGWFVANIAGKRVLRHEGEWQGFTSFITRHINDQTTVVLLTNLAGATLEPVAERVAEMYSSGELQAKRIDQ
jgi:CubicO group peptidase (beta-lactamase class C family)